MRPRQALHEPVLADLNIVSKSISDVVYVILRNHLDDLLVPVARAFQNLFALSKSRNAAKRRRANDRCNRYAHLIATSMAAEKGTWPPASLAGSARIHVRAWLPLPLLSEGLSLQSWGVLM